MDSVKTTESRAGGSEGTSVVIDELLGCIEAGDLSGFERLGERVVLDATVPNWRFTVRGAESVRAEFERWYTEPGQFEDLARTTLPGGELVTFTLRWEEGGVPHAANQAHVLTVRGGRIERDQVWCGGRWSASLLAEMAEAANG